jgi:hypothetical protein
MCFLARTVAHPEGGDVAGNKDGTITNRRKPKKPRENLLHCTYEDILSVRWRRKTFSNK